MSTIPRTRTPRLDNLQSETAKVERKAKFLKPRKIRKKVLLTPKEKHERFSFDPSRGKRVTFFFFFFVSSLARNKSSIVFLIPFFIFNDAQVSGCELWNFLQ